MGSLLGPVFVSQRYQVYVDQLTIVGCCTNQTDNME